MRPLLVKDWMTPDPITITSETTLPVAYHLMKLHSVRRLPVVRDDGRLIGIVTMGDIREARPKEGTSLNLWEVHIAAASLEVRDFMTPGPLTVSPEMPIGEAALLMLRHKIGGLPVVVGEEVVGIITESDIFRVLVENMLTSESAAYP